MSDLILRVLGAVQAFLVATVLLTGPAVFASGDDSPFYFDESGRMQQHGYWSPNSRSKSDFDTDRRMYNDHMNREILKQNEALTQSYYDSKPYAPPSGSSDYWISGPDGQSQWCRPIAPRQVICQ